MSDPGRAAPTTLAEWLRRRAERSPDRAAIGGGENSWSYAALEDRVERLSAVLAEGGIKAGDRVAYLGFNHPMIAAALFAAARLGAAFVPLNFRLTARELEFVIGDAGVHTLLAGEEHAAVVEAVRPSIPCERILRVGSPVPGVEALEPLLAAASKVPSARSPEPDDVALLMYTSGTTGRPKGAILTHANLWANNLNWMLASDFSSRDVGLNCAPMFHVGGLCVTVLPILFAGGQVVLQQQFDPAAFLRAIERHRVTVTFAVPAMMLFASQHPDFTHADLSSLRLIVAGGAPVPEPLLRVYAERGIPVSHCYGMTESTSAVTFLETENAVRKLGSCGRPGMLSDVRLIDAAGRVLAEPRSKGEICMRGPNVTKGYWNLPGATAESLDGDGWFRSGDVGYFDEDGFLYVCDRVKDMIISGGENVYPAEIESALYEHSAIAEVAVIGVPDERWGERVVAVVALKPGTSLALEDLQSFARERLAGYKIPRELRFLDALPRNSNGKVVKMELRMLSP